MSLAADHDSALAGTGAQTEGLVHANLEQIAERLGQAFRVKMLVKAKATAARVPTWTRNAVAAPQLVEHAIRRGEGRDATVET